MNTYTRIEQSAATYRFSGGTLFVLLACMLLAYSPLSASGTSEAASEPAPASAAAEAGDKPYSVDAEGRIDWYTFSGFRRYHAICHTCHGPAGLGGSFAPSLLDAINKKGLSYEKYLETVVNGLKIETAGTQSSMPAFATDPNVMCFVDDIYAYLVARADGVLGPTRPAKKQPKPEAAKERDNSCMGG